NASSSVTSFSSIFCKIKLNRYFISHVERMAVPSRACECVHAHQLEIPIRHDALLILRIDEETDMRIRPLEFRDLAFDRHDFLVVILRRKRVMRECLNDRSQESGNYENAKSEFHGNYLIEFREIVVRAGKRVKGWHLMVVG